MGFDDGAIAHDRFRDGARGASMTPGSRRRVGRGLKRATDIAGAVVGLTVLAPVFAIVHLAIRVCLGRPVIFRQQRPGYKGQPFYLYKFRTMVQETHQDGRLLRDDERIGRLGKLIRKLSLDELPQLWNVLRGDMSLVGPRPLLMEYLERYTSEQMRRHDVRPGITGLAQVNGRQDIPFSKRLELDVWYVDHWSLMLDIKILWKTLVRVLGSAGVRTGQNVSEVDDIGLSSTGREDD